jgi:Plasmid pRiA4b ORF-3-like protein
MAKQTTHVLRASLKPRLYRDVEIEGSKSLFYLAGGITAAFDFDFDHAFGFYSDLKNPYSRAGERYELFADIEDIESDAGSVERTKAGSVFGTVGKKMLFLFDYGDEWRFQLEVIGLGEKVPKTRYPRIVSTVGKAPPQYPSFDDDEE